MDKSYLAFPLYALTLGLVYFSLYKNIFTYILLVPWKRFLKVEFLAQKFKKLKKNLMKYYCQVAFGKFILLHSPRCASEHTAV